MAKVGIYVKLNNSGCNAVRNSPEVQHDILRRTQAIADRASATFGGNFIADVQPGRTRAHAMAKPADDDAARVNARTNALLKSIDAGRS
jgi:hypothetical protein